MSTFLVLSERIFISFVVRLMSADPLLALGFSEAIE